MTRKQIERKFLNKGMNLRKFDAGDKHKEGPSGRQYRWYVATGPWVPQIKFFTLAEAAEWVGYYWEHYAMGDFRVRAMEANRYTE